MLGFDPAKNERAFKERIGIVLQETGVEPYLTVAEAIELYRGYYPHPRPLDEVIEVVGLEEKRDARVQEAVRRAAASARRRDRTRRGPGTAVPRRADDGLRPVGPAQRLDDDREPQRRSARRSS